MINWGTRLKAVVTISILPSCVSGYAKGEFLQPRLCLIHGDGLRVIGHQQSKLSRRSCRFKCRDVVDDRLALDEQVSHRLNEPFGQRRKGHLSSHLKSVMKGFTQAG